MSEATVAIPEPTESAKKVIQEVGTLSDNDRAAVLLDVIGGQNVLWLSNFVKVFEQKFGVTAAAPVAIAAGPASSASEGAAVAEAKTSFDVILKDSGQNKIQVIKVVRQATNLGLKEAKGLVDSAPKPVKEGLTKDEADALKKEMEAAGAVVEIK